jgi:hypothetical protein
MGKQRDEIDAPDIEGNEECKSGMYGTGGPAVKWEAKWHAHGETERNMKRENVVVPAAGLWPSMGSISSTNCQVGVAARRSRCGRDERCVPGNLEARWSAASGVFNGVAFAGICQKIAA